MMSVSAKQPIQDEAHRIREEYQNFAYIVSHDLSAPLRHIKEFVRLLVSAREQNLNEEEREYIRMLEGSLKRVDDMQQGLLAFSRVNTVTHEFETISANEIVQNVINALEGDVLEYNPTIEVGDLPDVLGDPAQIYTVFYNIIENAIKFHKEGAARKISINAESDDTSHIFTILDNGIGIQEQFFDDIFTMFRRLHAAGYYDGRGVGLTVAKKIIEHHGGTITLESKPDEHTKVIFSLPKT